MKYVGEVNEFDFEMLFLISILTAMVYRLFSI